MKRQYHIQLQDTKESFFCWEEECILEAMHRSGSGPFHIGCFGGGCGVCKIRIVQGEYRIFKRMSRGHISLQEEMEHIVLLCCVKPLGDLTLALLKD